MKKDKSPELTPLEKKYRHKIVEVLYTYGVTIGRDGSSVLFRASELTSPSRTWRS